MQVFLTGATGLLGSELLVRLCARAEVERVVCLVRPRAGATVLARVRRVFEIHCHEFPASKLSVVEGELGAGAGLSAAFSGGAQPDVVVHAAANTSFLPQNSAAIERSNIAGLEQLLLWARGLRRLRTFLHIGTAAVCGVDAVHRVVSEDDAGTLPRRQLLSYTDSKWRGEQLVRRFLPEEAVLIARPSILMGDSRGLPPRSPVVLWAMAAINRLRLVPANALAALDVVPVDFAAEAIVRLLFVRRRHDVYHVSSGPRAHTSARSLSELLGSRFDDAPPFQFLPRSETASLRRWIRGREPIRSLESQAKYLGYWDRVFGDRRRALALLSALDPYFRFMELGQVFDNGRLAGDAGIVTPAPAHVYLDACLEHIARIDVPGGCADP